MLDTIRLQVFLYAAESLNFSEAARQLNLTQPTVSHHIKMLEQDLGVPLFDRSGGALRLTEAGRLLLPRARKLLHEMSSTEHLLSSLDSEIAGELRIACSTTTGKYILPLLAARFHQRHPAVNTVILSCTAEHVVPHLLLKEADVGVVNYDACGGDYECQAFFTDHIILIVPASHPFVGRDFIDCTELLTTPHIIREPASGTRRVLLAELGKHEIALEDMNIFLELGNAEAIVKTVEAGFGVSFVSHLAANWALRLGTVVEVPVAGFDLRRKNYMIRHQRGVSHRRVDAFWGFIHHPDNADLLQLAEG